MRPDGLWRLVSRKLERFSYGGEVVAKHKFSRELTVFELRNPAGVHFGFRSEGKSSCTFTPAEAWKLARLLDNISENKNDGVTP